MCHSLLNHDAYRCPCQNNIPLKTKLKPCINLKQQGTTPECESTPLSYLNPNNIKSSLSLYLHYDSLF